METVKNNSTDSEFYVVQFIELPFEGIFNYICVPHSWIVYRGQNQLVAVAYPKDEPHITTRNRVMLKERSSARWRCYVAVIKYESDNFKDAQRWIVEQHDFGDIMAPRPRRMTINNRVPNTGGVSKKESTFSNSQSMIKMSTQLNNRINGARLLEPVDHKRLMNVNTVDPRYTFQSFTNLSSVSQNLPSTSQQSLPTQPQYPKSSKHNMLKNLLSNQGNYEQELLNKSTERNNYDNRPNYHTISSSSMLSSIKQTSTNLSNLLNLPSESPQVREPQLNQQNSGTQTQIPKYRIDISLKQKNNRQPTLQGVTKKKPSSNLAKLPSSIQKTLLSTRNKRLLSKQQLQTNPSERAYHGLHLDSNLVADITVTVEYVTPNDIEITNNLYCSRIPSESSSDMPIAAQTSTLTNHQTNPQLVLEQEMLDRCDAFLTKTSVILRNMCDMLSNLQSSINATNQTYKNLIGLFKTFNAMEQI